MDKCGKNQNEMKLQALQLAELFGQIKNLIFNTQVKINYTNESVYKIQTNIKHE